MLKLLYKMNLFLFKLVKFEMKWNCMLLMLEYIEIFGMKISYILLISMIKKDII